MSILASGYSVRVFKVASDAAHGGDQFKLPSWFGNPLDMLKFLAAALLGLSAFWLASLLALAIVEVSIRATTGLWILNFGSAGELLQLAYHRSPLSTVALIIPVGAIACWLTCFVPVMLWHYSRERRILSVLEWPTISHVVSSNFGSLVFALSIIVAVVVPINFLLCGLWWGAPLLAFVAFLADVVAFAIVAWICIRIERRACNCGVRQ
jgi:hypothetical protein